MATGNSGTDSGEGRETPQPPGRNSRRWKSLFWLVPLVLVLFVVVSDLFGWAYLRKPVASLLGAKLERRVEIGPPFRIHLRRTIPIRVGSLFVAAPHWSQEPHFVDIEDIQADLDWGVLVGRQPHLRRLSVARADIRAERDEQGRASWSIGSKDDPSSELVLPPIEQLSIGDAAIKINDARNDLQLQAAAATGEGQGDRQGGGRGEAGAGLVVNGQGSWKSDPLSFELRTAGLLPLLEGGAPAHIDLKGKLNSTELAFNGTVSDLIRFQNVSGKVSAQGASLGDLTAIPGLTMPSTPPYRLEGEIQRDGATIKVDVSRADIGSSSMAAQLEYDGASTPPVLRGSLDASRLVLQDLGPSIGTTPGQSAKASKTREDARQPMRTPPPTADKDPGASARPAPSGKKAAAAGTDAGGKDAARKPPGVLPTREFDLPSLRAMNADVDIDLQKLDLGTDALRPLQSLKAKLLLDGGVLKLQDLRSSLAGGTVTGSTVLDGSAADRAPTFNANLGWNRVEIKNWLKISDGDYFVAGRFSGKTILKGGGKSTAAILGSLGGTVKGRIDGGSISHQIVEIAGLDAAQALGVFFGGDKPLALSCALVDLVADKGTVTSNLLLFNTKDTIFFVQGSIDFRNERLNLKLLQSPKDWSPLSLRSPVTIGGTLGDPSVGVEAAPIVLKVLSSIILGAVTPLAALLPFIEMGDDSTREGCAPAIEAVRTRAAALKTEPAVPAGADEGKPPGGSATDGEGVLRRPGRLPGERP